MYILANMWFTKLIKQFFFWIDKIVYNFISSIYDLLITIARTSVLTQADIADMAGRIYKLLAIFMVFKVTLSLITYVVNPDDFSDKSKGVAKLGTNIVISLAMLVLTPYIFNYAYQFQTIILEDNSLATLIFGGSTDEENSFFNSAGDDMAYITMSAFISPNLSLGDIHECSTLIDPETKKFNTACKTALNDEANENFKEQTLANYVAGVENNSLGLMLRQDLVLATDSANEEFIMDYKFIFSTVVGVIVILLLVTFCMDVALRSIKLAFLQLIAPIPILSYVDPKSGKDGLFKKWYEMCIKTFISLFVRLIALYFAVYIISKVADMKMVDLVDGSYQTNAFVAIFIIIGALMFAKQLPKILEGLGIKLDGDGKFFLNPFKKFEEQALGGKRITGAAGGAIAGLIGGKGNPFRAISGAARGFAGNKGYAGGLSAQADVNRKMRDARIKGAGFLGSRFAGISSRYGLDDADLEGRAIRLRKDKRALELKQRDVESQVKVEEAKKKQKQDSIALRKKEIEKHKRMQGAVSKMEERAKTEIQNGNGGSIGKEYLTRKAQAEYYENNIGKEIEIDGKKTRITAEMAGTARKSANNYLNDEGMKAYMSAASTGKFDDGTDDKTLQNSYKTYVDAATNLGLDVSTDGGTIHSQYGKSKGDVGDIEREIHPTEVEISDIDDKIRNLQTKKDFEYSGTIPEDMNIEVVDGKISYEDAQALIARREKELKDEQDQRNLNRTLAKDRSISIGSGK